MLMRFAPRSSSSLFRLSLAVPELLISSKSFGCLMGTNPVVVFTTFWKADRLRRQGEALLRSSSHGVEYFQDPLAS